MPAPHQPLRVAQATLSPHGGCSLCRNQTGPFVDVGEPQGVLGRCYICATCVRLSAMQLGLAAGDEQADLLHAREREVKLEQKTQRLENGRRKLLDDNAKKDTKIGELTEQLERADGRVEQLEGLIRADAEASLAVIAK